jgi:PhzF family phenazine biosynthesis protein
MTPEVHLVSVFAASPRGGNPAPIVADAAGMSDQDMQEVARAHGHESGFVLPPPDGSGCDYSFRFWVPNHEMEMCGHATVGAVWLLDRLGVLPRDDVRIWTRSGIVEAHVSDVSGSRQVEISQPQGRVEPVPDAETSEAEILSVLGIKANETAPLPIQNACTSRVKTLVPLKSVEALDGLRPDYARMKAICERIGSTGLYPYAWSDLPGQVFDARQFPKSSGYPEDAATGIAAAALAFGLLRNGLVEPTNRKITIRQGRAMGRPSEITVRFRVDPDAALQGCWLGGGARLQ